MIKTEKIQNLFEQAITHHEEHDCSAPPYENGKKLIDYIEKIQARDILEIGTGMGYTVALMALVNSDIKIDTLEKDAVHFEVAKKFAEDQGVGNQVNIINELAEDYLPNVGKQYDLIFFDGYQIHYQFLDFYKKLLRPGGTLFLANNHLQSRTSKQFFEELTQSGEWNIVDQFDDTTIAIKNR